VIFFKKSSSDLPVSSVPSVVEILVVAAGVAALTAIVAAQAPTVDVTARALQPGELAVVTIDTPATATRVTVRALDRQRPAYRVDATHWRALVGLDLDVKPATYTLTVDVDAQPATRELVVRAKTFPSRRLTVDPNFVTPPPSAAERIAREARLLEATWNTVTPERLWTERFVRPVSEPANSAFGSRSVFNGQRRNAHGGADFLSPAGTPIHAPNAGLVVIARDLYYSGNTAVIDHGLGLYSMFAHLSAFEVREGERVAVGQAIGRVGATGRVTGPHLHWAVRVNGARVDPLSLLAALGKN
jgi:murein DD-endopeptidase MepM/ murein hydrolase activator NlpD